MLFYHLFYYLLSYFQASENVTATYLFAKDETHLFDHLNIPSINLGQYQNPTRNS